MNPWFKHLAEVRNANPNIKDVGELAKLAKKTYKPAAKTTCIKTCVKKCKAKHNKTKKGGKGANVWGLDADGNRTFNGATTWDAGRRQKEGGKKSRKSKKSKKSKKFRKSRKGGWSSVPLCVSSGACVDRSSFK